MRKHFWSAVGILVMTFLALGSIDTNTSNVPPVPTASQVDRTFAERTAKYDQDLAAWNKSREEAETDKAQLPKQIEALDSTKPTPPTLQEREWKTADGKYKTNAVLVDTDGKTATLRKPDGTNVTVPMAQLDAESRSYIANELIMFRLRLRSWETKRRELADKLASADARITSGDRSKPDKPTREQVAQELAAEAAEAAAQNERSRLASEEAARQLAAQRAEEEYDQDGLVLLKKTVKGIGDEFGGKITGVVENRRSHKLSYAQITFNLYDRSGAQVGSAMANINGLEPGGRWRFEATTFGTDFSTYKFDELSGF